ncbi:hypothetical protein [Jannaschia rubra]|uniref:hypothetical protein n=1 Tax=Jannaschia rubra TaxID=282197 RepID=UPI0024905E46|nr:hypothetical protein [Jannaschia rubra]
MTGCVCNGANEPPYPLPTKKTKFTFKTDTHQGAGFNELMFGEEKDKQIDILNDRNKTIGRDQSESVARDMSSATSTSRTSMPTI